MSTQTAEKQESPPASRALAIPGSVVAGGQVRALVPQDMDGAWRMAGAVHAGGIVPYGIDTREKAMIAILHGLEIGLTPMNAMQSIAVINGKPTIYGDAAIGLVRASGLMEWIKETVSGEGDAMTAKCVVKRKHEAEAIEGEFSVADAKTAGLWTKTGKNGQPTPWQTYPKRMLKFRARAFALRDGFADVLKGMHIREEVEDYDTGTGVVIDHSNDDGPPAPPPVPAQDAPPTVPADDVVDEAVTLEEIAEANALGESFEDDGPPDPGATVAVAADRQEPAHVDKHGRRTMPSPEERPFDFLVWLKDRLAECDADMLDSAWNDSLAINVERLPLEHREAAMGLYRVRERELEGAPGPSPDTQMIAEITKIDRRLGLIQWSTRNAAAVAALPQDAKARVEAALNRHIQNLEGAEKS